MNKWHGPQWEFRQQISYQKQKWEEFDTYESFWKLTTLLMWSTPYNYNRILRHTLTTINSRCYKQDMLYYVITLQPAKLRKTFYSFCIGAAWSLVNTEATDVCHCYNIDLFQLKMPWGATHGLATNAFCMIINSYKHIHKSGMLVFNIRTKIPLMICKQMKSTSHIIPSFKLYPGYDLGWKLWSNLYSGSDVWVFEIITNPYFGYVFGIRHCAQFFPHVKVDWTLCYAMLHPIVRGLQMHGDSVIGQSSIRFES